MEIKQLQLAFTFPPILHSASIAISLNGEEEPARGVGLSNESREEAVYNAIVDALPEKKGIKRFQQKGTKKDSILDFATSALSKLTKPP